MKKVLALLLALFLVVGLVPTGFVFAEETTPANTPVYHITTEAVYGTVYAADHVMYQKDTVPHTLGISFDYYAVGGSLRVQNASGGLFTDGSKVVRDTQTGSEMLQGGVNHFSGTVTTAGSTNGSYVGYALGISSRGVVCDYYIWNIVYTIDGVDYDVTNLFIPDGTSMETTTYGAVFGSSEEEPDETDPSTTVYHINTEAVYGSVYSADRVMYQKDTTPHTLGISFDYYAISGSLRVQNVSNGLFTDGSKVVKDAQTGSEMLQGGVNHFSGTVTTAGSTNGSNVGYALGISARGVVCEYYIWNVVYTIDGVDYDATNLSVPEGITMETTTYGAVFGGEDEPVDEDVQAYQLDFVNHTASNGFPTVRFTEAYSATGKSVTLSFDYYLPEAIPQVMMKNVSSGRDLIDEATGTHLLQKGVHHFSFKDSSFDSSCFSPGFQMGNAVFGQIYIWNYSATVNGLESFVGARGEAPVYELLYSEIPFEGTSVIESISGTTVTLNAQSGYEYSADGETVVDSNVFENLSYDTKYTFYSRKVGSTNNGRGSTVLIPSAPAVLYGETRLSVLKNSEYEYSIDGKNWSRSNNFGNLTAGASYTVYQRLIVKGTVYPVSSEGTTVLLNGHDNLPMTDANALRLVKQAVLSDKNDYAADINADWIVDVRDLVHLKKKQAGLLAEEYDTVPAAIRTYLDEAKFYNTEDYTYTVSPTYVKDYIRPMPVEISFAVPNAAQASAVTVSVSPNADMSGATNYYFTAAQIKNGSVTAAVYHLFVGTKYYWQATVSYQNGTTQQSGVTPFIVKDGVRFINTEKINNMRDVGGWMTQDGEMVKQGLVYRSAHMDDATANDKNLLKNVLGIKTEIDLRRTDENNGITSSPLGNDVTYVHISSYNYTGYFTDPALAASVFRMFASPDNYPIAFHCVGGADRTGTLAFMLKALLGVEENDLVADFELTPGRVRNSSDWTNFPAFMSAVHALPGDTLQEKAYNFYHDRAGLTAMELSNITNIQLNDSALFANESLGSQTVTAGNDATFRLIERQSGGVASVTLNGADADYSYANGTLTVRNVTGNGTASGTITLRDGKTLDFEVSVK
ncbi:MAG: tyrosine-protein phosphatase [Clostridia bacterium]|nr:tyrosine-protein phosphatase [Clostridia bacterium]